MSTMPHMLMLIEIENRPHSLEGYLFQHVVIETLNVNQEDVDREYIGLFE